MLPSVRSENLGRSGSCCQRALSARNQRQWSDYNAIRHSRELSVLLELELFVCTKCAAHDAWRGNYSNHFPFWNLPTTWPRHKTVPFSLEFPTQVEAPQHQRAKGTYSYDVFWLRLEKVPKSNSWTSSRYDAKFWQAIRNSYGELCAKLFHVGV